MRKLLVVLAVVALSTVMFTVPALAMPRASPPTMVLADNTMMTPTAMATHQAFLTEARVLRKTMWTQMTLDAITYHGGRNCLSGAQLVTQMNQADFTRNLSGQTLIRTGQELTITAIEYNCPMCSALLAQNTFATMEQRHDAANQYVDWNMPAPAIRMDAINNVNRVTTVILRL